MGIKANDNTIGTAVKKERWMRVGNTALVGGEKVTITGMDDTRIEHKEYVYTIECKHQGNRTSTRYYPNQVQPDNN